MANLVLRSRALWSELELSPIPKLVLQGTRDSYSPLSTLRDLVLQYNECDPQPGPLELQVGQLRRPQAEGSLGGTRQLHACRWQCQCHHHQQQPASQYTRPGSCPPIRLV